MTEQEAYIILGLNEDADPQEIQDKYQELFSDFQIRLSNAPTPNLKKLYQKNLQELEEAAALIGEGGGDTGSDLPSSAPQIQRRSSKPNPASKPKPNPAAGTSRKAETVPQQKKSSKGTLIGGLLALVGIAAAVLSFLLYTQYQGEMDKKVADLEEEIAEGKEAKEKLAFYEKNFEQQKLKIQNTGMKNLVLKEVTATFINDDGKLEKAEYIADVVIGPGKTHTAQVVKGASTEYDGSVICYSLGYMYDGYAYLLGGVYSNESDDGVLKINMDTH